MPTRHIEDGQRAFFLEECKTGMAQAAEMLSKFLKPGFNFQIEWNANGIGLSQTASQVEISLEVDGALAGTMRLRFTAENACGLAGLLLRREPPTALGSDDVRSTLNEVGNIFASGVLFSLDNRLGIRAMPSPPTFNVLECDSPFADDPCRNEMLPMRARLVCLSAEGLLLEGTVLFMVSHKSLAKLAKDGLLSNPGPVVSS